MREQTDPVGEKKRSPNPRRSSSSHSSVTLGKYGTLRRNYLASERPILYLNLLLSGKLAEHLTETERLAEEMRETLTAELSRSNPIPSEASFFEKLRIMSETERQIDEAILSTLIYETTD